MPNTPKEDSSDNLGEAFYRLLGESATSRREEREEERHKEIVAVHKQIARYTIIVGVVTFIYALSAVATYFLSAAMFEHSKTFFGDMNATQFAEYVAGLASESFRAIAYDVANDVFDNLTQDSITLDNMTQKP